MAGLALGVGAACSARLSDGTSEGETGGGESTGTGTGTGTDTGATTTTEDGGEVEVDDGETAVILDIPPEPCDELEEVWVDWEFPPECGTDEWGYDPVCFFPPEGTTCEQEPFADWCILGAYSCGLITGGEEIQCGPYTTPEGACCYMVTGDCAVGRPYLVAGEARLAPLSNRGSAWARATRVTLPGSDARRAVLAEAWIREGLAEHASVAAFARFTRELLALGAPPRLVVDSLRAGLDEVEHARTCFGLAAAHGDPRGPGRLDVRDPAPVDVVSVAVRLAAEACIAETVSAELLAEAARSTDDAALGEALGEMADDERRHVCLAWSALAWLCARGGEPVWRAVERVMAEPERWIGFGSLPVRDQRTVAIRTIDQIIRPAWRVLARRRTSPAVST